MAPDTVPDTVPRPVTVVFAGVLPIIVNDPENDESDCVICHVISPGPDESEAWPFQVPFTVDAVGVGDGELG